MPRDLSTETVEEINELYQSSAWLTLLTVKNSNEETKMNLVINTEDVIFQGVTYLKTNVEIGDITQATSGSLPTVPLKIQNVDRIVGQMVESDDDFGSGWIINIKVVNEKHLGTTPIYNPDDIISEEFTVTEVSTAFDFVSFTLSVGRNPMIVQFPAMKFSPATCQRTFDNKLTGCPYSTQGKDGTSYDFCNKTIENCKERYSTTRTNSNNERIGIPFLAFQGMSRRAIFKA